MLRAARRSLTIIILCLLPIPALATPISFSVVYVWGVNGSPETFSLFDALARLDLESKGYGYSSTFIGFETLRPPDLFPIPTPLSEVTDFWAGHLGIRTLIGHSKGAAYVVNNSSSLFPDFLVSLDVVDPSCQFSFFITPCLSANAKYAAYNYYELNSLFLFNGWPIIGGVTANIDASNCLGTAIFHTTIHDSLCVIGDVSSKLADLGSALSTPTTVPEPGMWLLFSSGLGILIWIRYKGGRSARQAD